jgi:preprotein translocase SecE subunit
MAAGAVREERREGGIMGVVDTVRSWPTRIRDFYRETRLEMKRVTYPETKQIKATTVVVIITVFFFGFYFLVTDAVFGTVVDFIFRQFRG